MKQTTKKDLILIGAIASAIFALIVGLLDSYIGAIFFLILGICLIKISKSFKPKNVEPLSDEETQIHAYEHEDI